MLHQLKSKLVKKIAKDEKWPINIGGNDEEREELICEWVAVEDLETDPNKPEKTKESRLEGRWRSVPRQPSTK